MARLEVLGPRLDACDPVFGGRDTTNVFATDLSAIAYPWTRCIANSQGEVALLVQEYQVVPESFNDLVAQLGNMSTISTSLKCTLTNCSSLFLRTSLLVQKLVNLQTMESSFLGSIVCQSSLCTLTVGNELIRALQLNINLQQRAVAQLPLGSGVVMLLSVNVSKHDRRVLCLADARCGQWNVATDDFSWDSTI